MEEILIERMSWPQVRKAIDSGFKRVIVPIGAMEQHGPHLPIATDTLIGYAIATRLAAMLGKTLVSPAITVGWSEGHLSHAGTVSISPETLKTLIVEYCRSLAAHGFKEILLLPSHGGNYRPVGEVLPRLREEIKGVRIIASDTDMDDSVRESAEFNRKHNLDPKKMGVHSGQGETSELLAIHPELVDMSKAVEGFTGDASVRWRAKVPPPMATMSPTGILGDAREATAELGRLMIEDKLKRLVSLVDSQSS